jgi:hypothetical protein
MRASCDEPRTRTWARLTSSIANVSVNRRALAIAASGSGYRYDSAAAPSITRRGSCANKNPKFDDRLASSSTGSAMTPHPPRQLRRALQEIGNRGLCPVISEAASDGKSAEFTCSSPDRCALRWTARKARSQAFRTYCCTLLLYSASAAFSAVRKTSLTWVELSGLEPLTSCMP